MTSLKLTNFKSVSRPNLEPPSHTLPFKFCATWLITWRTQSRAVSLNLLRVAVGRCWEEQNSHCLRNTALSLRAIFNLKQTGRECILVEGCRKATRKLFYHSNPYWISLSVWEYKTSQMQWNWMLHSLLTQFQFHIFVNGAQSTRTRSIRWHR